VLVKYYFGERSGSVASRFVSVKYAGRPNVPSNSQLLEAVSASGGFTGRPKAFIGVVLRATVMRLWLGHTFFQN
jgi:hypothetical protein